MRMPSSREIHNIITGEKNVTESFFKVYINFQLTLYSNSTKIF